MPPERRLALPVEPTTSLDCRWVPATGSAGATVVYLHGFGSTQSGEKADYFRARAAAAGLGFFSLDFRGHGGSGGGMLGLTLSRCLEDVSTARRFLAGEGVRRLAVMGSSMGGLVGLWHAALEPEGLVAGVFIAPAIGLGEDLAGLLGEEGMRRWRETGVWEVTNELGTFEVGWGMAEDLRRYPAERLAEKHRVPSLLFQGRLDDRVSWRRVASFAEAAAGEARLDLFADGDHRLLEERSEMWSRARGFLARRLAVAVR